MANSTIVDLFARKRVLHLQNYPNDQLDFDGLDVTRRFARSSDAHIGRGRFSDVYRGIFEGSTLAVVKVLRFPVRSNNKDPEYEYWMNRFFRELNHWNGLQHPNVARMLGYTFDEKGIGLVSLWYAKEDLVHYLSENPEAGKPDLILDVADGLDYLHNNPKPLIHGDLKGLNVFVGGNGIACLGDFGISKQVCDLDRETGFTTFGGWGTTEWMAPELFLKDAKATLASDVYAFGGVLIQICCPGKVPYGYHKRDSEIIKQAKARGELPDRGEYLEITSDELWSTMCQCWAQDPGARPPIEDINVALHRQFQRLPRTVDDSTPGPRALAPSSPGGDEEQPESNLEDTKSALRSGKFDLFKIDTTRAPLKGGFSDVFFGMNTATQMNLAFKRASSELGQDLWNQVAEIWSALDHTNILPFFGQMEFESKLHYVTPWMEQGNLSDFMEDYVQYVEKRDLSPKLRHPDHIYESFKEGRMIREIASGLAYIHSQGYIHGDMRGERVLIAPDGSALLSIPPQLKAPGTLALNGPKVSGSMRWQAPELLKAQELTSKSDVYAFAMVIVEILTGKVPFSGRPHPALITAVLEGQRPIDDPRTRRAVDFTQFWKLASLCWADEVDSRPSMEDVLNGLSPAM